MTGTLQSGQKIMFLNSPTNPKTVYTVEFIFEDSQGDFTVYREDVDDNGNPYKLRYMINGLLVPTSGLVVVDD